MKMTTLFERVFELLLSTYPQAYQEEFSQEKQQVFQQILTDAAQCSAFAVFLVFFRELKDYPFLVLREHRRNSIRSEMALAADGAGITVNGCPRCGLAKTVDARYCANCGRAFIPFKQHTKERMKDALNNRWTLWTSIGIFLIAFSLAWSYQILMYGYYPATNWIELGMICLVSVLLGWGLFKQSSNGRKLRLLLLTTVFTILFSEAISRLDYHFLHHTLAPGESLSFKFLGTETYVMYIEEDIEIEAQPPFLPDRGKYWSRFYIPTSPNNTTQPFPGVVIERTWLAYNFYGPGLMLFIIGSIWAGNRLARKRTAQHAFTP